MKKLIFSIGACLSIFGPLQSASAFNYHFGDLILVFRSSGLNDVEFDLGSVSNYLSLAPGTVQTVTGWDVNAVLTNRPSGSLAGDHFIVLANSGPANPGAQSSEADFLTGPGAPTPKDVSQSLFSQQNSVITTVGTNAYLFTSGSATATAVIPPSDPRSYTKTASGATVDPTKLGGTSAFNVETAAPGAARFYQIGSVNGATPPAATWVGTFAIDDNNVLTYTAGSATPTAVTLSVVDNGDGSVSVSFPSKTGVNYQLLTSPTVNGPIATGDWGSTSTGHTLGTGGIVTFLDTPESADAFYVVQSY